MRSEQFFASFAFPPPPALCPAEAISSRRPEGQGMVRPAFWRAADEPHDLAPGVRRRSMGFSLISRRSADKLPIDMGSEGVPRPAATPFLNFKPRPIPF